jgi:hypothetical protein
LSILKKTFKRSNAIEIEHTLRRVIQSPMGVNRDTVETRRFGLLENVFPERSGRQPPRVKLAREEEDALPEDGETIGIPGNGVGEVVGNAREQIGYVRVGGVDERRCEEDQRREPREKCTELHGSLSRRENCGSGQREKVRKSGRLGIRSMPVRLYAPIRAGR